MERKKYPTLSVNETQENTVSGSLVERQRLMQVLGMSYSGERNLYEALGYPQTLQFQDYAGRYSRQDIAKAIIDRPAKATWQGAVGIEESSAQEITELEKQWKELDNRLGLKTRFSRVDKLSAIGCYGILLLGLDDVKKPEDWQKPPVKGRKLMYVKPYSEGTARIITYEEDSSNERFGQPLMYEIKTSQSRGSTGTSSPVYINRIVHHSRVIHIIDDVLEDDVMGIPKLEVVYNRLMDLEKIIGGDAEMFWRNARPGYQGKVDKDYTMTDPAKEALKEQISEYEHNLRRMLVNEGVTYEALQQMVHDPMNHVDIQIQMIATVTGIPKRILTGTERGELSSQQDASEWRSYVQGRRDDHAEPHIVRPFINRCIELGILPKPVKEDYKILWSDLYAMSKAEKVKIGMDRSTALKNYTGTPMAEAVIPPEGFLEFFLGLEDSEIEYLKQLGESEVLRESAVTQAQAMKPEPAPIKTPEKPVALPKAKKITK